MHLQVDTSNSFPIRRPLTEQPEDVRGGDVRPRDQALPSSRELGGVLDPNTLTRAIEDLERSGYRPLRHRPEASEPASIGWCPPLQGATHETAKGT